MKLRVTRKSYTRREGGKLKVYRPGDTFDGSEGALRLFGDRLAKASNQDDAKDAEGEKFEPAVQAVFDSNGDDAKALIPELSDSDLLTVEKFEKRKGVQSAIADEVKRRQEGAE